MKSLIVIIVLLGWLGLSNAEETLPEKAQTTINASKRTASKALHRTKEALCGKLTGDSKVECLAKETKNNAEESKDALKDKAKEVKNKID